MPSAASAPTCRNRSGAPKPGSAPPRLRRRQAGENVIATIGAQITELKAQLTKFRAETAEIRAEIKFQTSRIDVLQRVIWRVIWARPSSVCSTRRSPTRFSLEVRGLAPGG